MVPIKKNFQAIVLAGMVLVGVLAPCVPSTAQVPIDFDDIVPDDDLQDAQQAQHEQHERYGHQYPQHTDDNP